MPYPGSSRFALTKPDVVIWDDEREVTINNEMLHHNVDYTPYEGISVRGWPGTVLSRGDVVWENGEIAGEQDRGQFLPCAQPEKALPAGRPVTDFQPV